MNTLTAFIAGFILGAISIGCWKEFENQAVNGPLPEGCSIIKVDSCQYLMTPVGVTHLSSCSHTQNVIIKPRQ